MNECEYKQGRKIWKTALAIPGKIGAKRLALKNQKKE